MPPKMYTQREYDALDRRRKIGWARYFELLNTEVEVANVIVTPIRNNETGELQPFSSLPTHITQEFYDMASQLNKSYTCPICIDLVGKETIEITICGHTFHKECLSAAKEIKNECPTCRKKFF